MFYFEDKGFNLCKRYLTVASGNFVGTHCSFYWAWRKEPKTHLKYIQCMWLMRVAYILTLQSSTKTPHTKVREYTATWECRESKLLWNIVAGRNLCVAEPVGWGTVKKLNYKTIARWDSNLGYKQCCFVTPITLFTQNGHNVSLSLLKNMEELAKLRHTLSGFLQVTELRACFYHGWLIKKHKKSLKGE